MKKHLLSTLFCLISISIFAQLKPDTAWMTVYRESSTKINDLVHTKLDAKFDYDKSYLNGKVWITLKPHFYATDSLTLDAKGMDIARVTLIKDSPQKELKVTNQKDLKFTYDGWNLKIKLDKTYKRGENYTVFIEYTAKPNEVKVKGSAAINDAKGLYFINPKGEEKDKPTQIWTQGETEGTSVWVPTIDRPNQKCTSEILMTVPDKYVTLSNGKLVSQTKNGTLRTDHWKMELPHSPYLFFMGVGEFAVVRDKYKGKEVNYYVEKEYASTARKIFGLTPSMIAFYEKITGVEYPWVKYSQMVGRDYVSGAMENTTATLHQEAAQQDARELIDGNAWEGVIAHELFHQWFGDYVTAESWSNLTVNESFAEYSEFLWKQHHYDADVADDVLYATLRQYLSNPADAQKDLVRFYYEDKEDMFDLVSYQKGARVLHMLRNVVGDSAFFKGLNVYLTTNKFKSGEAHQLRLAMEEVSGRDLNWFFNQWYFSAGHPVVTIDYNYNESVKKVTVTIRQTQGADQLFRIPLTIDIYSGGTKTRHTVAIGKEEDSFTYGYTTKPDLINVDGDKIVLWDKTDNKTIENFIYQYKNAGNYVDRREAIVACAKLQDTPAGLELLKLAMKDKFYGLRENALLRLNLKSETVKSAVEPILVDLARHDKKSTVRAAALEILASYEKEEYKELFMANLNDSSYSVAGDALLGYATLDSVAGYAEARKQMKLKTKGKLTEAVSVLIMQSGTEDDFEYIALQFDALPVSQVKLEASAGFANYLGKVKSTERVKRGVDMIVKLREAVPKEYRTTTDGPLNQVILSGLMTKKESEGLKDQADYIKSKLP
jgi:aminopeptidase N